jgi:hypothetical protein
MKVPELTGALLNYWVAKAQGMNVYIKSGFCFIEETRTSYHPSENWEEGGEIIERNCIAIYRDEYRDASGRWAGYGATMPKTAGYASGSGPTHLIAAMRAFVASKFGDEVPDEVRP